MVHAVEATANFDFPTSLQPRAIAPVEDRLKVFVKQDRSPEVSCSPILDVCAAVVSDASELAKLYRQDYVWAHRETHFDTQAAEATLEEWEVALGSLDFRAVLVDAAKATKRGVVSDVRLLKCVDAGNARAVVGYALYELREKGSAKRKQRYCELVNIVVSAAYRGFGVGRLLFDEIQADLACEAPSYAGDIRLYVAQRNELPLNWYRRLGFKDGGWQSENVAGTEVKFLRMVLKKTA